MNYKKSKALTMAAMMMAMSENPMDREISEPIEIKPRPPKGAKEYFFNEHGTFINKDANWNHTVFKCYARTDEAAIKKFNRFKPTNKQLK